ncbi:MAG TPA: hypothetical protein VLL69_08160 [Streptosporangiaceae bacterium]|nr:hypothetical protein [Streptosporangiaceae bacterium]
MSFFESIPQPPPPPEPVLQRRPAWMRSDAVIPGSVPAESVLIRTGQVAVAIGSVRAYPNGFEFTVHIRLRREDETGWPGHSDPFERHRPGRGTPGDDDQLRLGILYADGRRAATTGERYQPPDDGDDGRLVLQRGGGGGSSRSCDWDFWVHPLPPEGPVTLVASWLEHGIAESRAELDGAAIRAAAQRALTLWPEEPEFEPGGAWRSQRITGGKPDDLGAGAEPDRPGSEGTDG